MLTSIQGSFILGASKGVLRIGGRIRACNKMGKYEYKSNLELYYSSISPVMASARPPEDDDGAHGGDLLESA